MKIYILYGQRKQSYEGQYLPELLDAVDDGVLDESPQIMTELRAKHVASKEFTGVEWFTLQMPKSALEEIQQRLAGVHPLGCAASMTPTESVS